MRPSTEVKPQRWARYAYNLTTPMGKNNQRLTGCAEHIALSRKVATEGMVLLENNGVLPLKNGATVSLFGIGTLDYVKGGGGSGKVYSEYVRDIYDGFLCKAPRINIYEPVTQYYLDYALPILHGFGDSQRDPWIDVPSGNKAEALYSEIDLPAQLIADAAKNSDIAIITIHRYSGEGWDRSSEKGDFYLTDTEQKLVDDVTSAFEHSVVVLDIGGMIDVSWIKNNPKIDAALLAWQAGMEGGLAIADILCGDVNPSGKLTDTFAKTFADYPSADTFNESDDYVCYYEDIYVGYRYFETIPGAKDKVNYPFGYGLSYTTFEISTPVASQTGDHIEIAVSVKNTGTLPGKEVVQIYYSAPQGVLGKSSISLVTFQKSKLLAPGEQEDMVLSFSIADMASYDDLGKLQMSAYVLEQGDYRFFAGNNCRDLKEAAWRYTVAEKFVVTKQLTQKCAPNQLEKRLLADGSFERLPSFPIAQYEVPCTPNTAKAPDTPKPVQFIDVAEGRISLDEFMAQMTDKELIHLMSGVAMRGVSNTEGFGDIRRLGIPAFMTADGPAGVRLKPQVGIPTTNWPCATLVTCTWDPQLAYEIGKAGAVECKENGLAVWLTPALNIHRNPLCGRNFEYLSEDPLLSGKFAAAKVNGIQSEHVAASAKHFACNNKEVNRKYSDSRVSERALREIYLRGFEICVKEAQPWTVMSSYNLINARRCCTSYEQLQGILRDEWGFEGIEITDWGTPCDQAWCVLSGNDIRMPNGEPEVLREALATGRIQRGHLETCARRILELFLKFD
ncbi:MAG: glycoside hydrolase family 3 C-terminal domain-containing protein [Oscillospiraceae bacterium]|nr:glycoside hydrolase family 3 C-terminal domain-containing protein [Oscillospiraceae bacterium]